MPQLTAPSQEDWDSWHVRELGVKDGSSPTVSLDVSGSIATREFLCSWPARYKVAAAFVGSCSTYTDSGTLKISRLNPMRLPNPDPDEVSPLWPVFHATKVVEITGHAWRDFDPGGTLYNPDGSEGFPGEESPREYQFEPEDTVNKFLCAKLKIQFERCPMEFKDDDEVFSGATGEITRNVQLVPMDGEVQYLTVPSSTQNYISPTGTGTGHNVPVPYPTGLTETIYRFVLRWHRIPYEVWEQGSNLKDRIFGDGTITNLPWLNAINSTNFYGYPPGTVMLEKVTERLDPSLLDQTTWPWTWTLDYQFAVKMMGWSFAWFFPNSTEFTGAGNVAKRMFVGRGSTYYAPGSETLPDLYSNYPERDFAEGLFTAAAL